MKKVLKKIILVGIVSALLVVAVPAFAGTSWVNFAKNMDWFQLWTDLVSDNNANRSDAEAYVSNVAGDYKANLVIYQGSTEVSNIATNVTDGQTRTFIIDSIADGKTVTLRGQTANWSIYKVEISGRFRADTE